MNTVPRRAALRSSCPPRNTICSPQARQTAGTGPPPRSARHVLSTAVLRQSPTLAHIHVHTRRRRGFKSTRTGVTLFQSTLQCSILPIFNSAHSESPCSRTKGNTIFWSRAGPGLDRLGMKLIHPFFTFSLGRTTNSVRGQSCRS